MHDSIQQAVTTAPTPPQHVAETESHVSARSPRASHSVTPHVADRDSVRSDSTDVAQTDSLAAAGVREGEVRSGVILVPQDNARLVERISAGGLSWIYGILLVVFCIVAFRFKNNKRYISVLFKNITEVRERHNMFDETVRETSFLILMNVLWSVSAGVILYSAICYLTSRGIDPAGWSGGMSLSSPLHIAVCMGVCTVYPLLMVCAYWVCGNVFSDRVRAGMWAKGFLASQAIMGIVFFPLALLCLSYPASLEIWLISALATFAIGKIMFLWKGFRIFLTQFLSWVLFLYYLCGLEIIPLILTYCGAAFLCRIIQ